MIGVRNSTGSALKDAHSGDAAKIISIVDWFDVVDDSIHLLDVRSDVDGDNKADSSPRKKIMHLMSSFKSSSKKIVTIPLQDVRSRSFELPPREKPFAILVSNMKDLETLNELLATNHSTTSKKNNIPACSSSSSRKRKKLIPWSIFGIVLDTEENQRLAEKRGILINDDDEKDDKGFVVAPRLWEPDKMVKTVLLGALLKLARQSSSADKTLQIWDLGAGAGRDAVFMAEELRAQQSRNWKVVAMDQRYRDAETDPASQFMARRGLSEVTECRRFDLNDIISFQELLQKQHSSETTVLTCILLVRYWNKELVELIANSSHIRSGAIFAISHFGIPSMTDDWNYQWPKSNHVVQYNELNNIFFTINNSTNEKKWELIHEKFVQDGDRGRPLLQFVARRL